MVDVRRVARNVERSVLGVLLVVVAVFWMHGVGSPGSHLVSLPSGAHGAAAVPQAHDTRSHPARTAGHDAHTDGPVTTMPCAFAVVGTPDPASRPAGPSGRVVACGDRMPAPLREAPEPPVPRRSL
ncbi:MAG: hypothetical protein IT197_01540 [Acidimicrobiia bacterium]|nr:hypothetical protein [Acidimicrobiia bacterium]